MTISDSIAEQHAEFAHGRTFIGVTRRTVPDAGWYWLPLGPPRLLPATAAQDAARLVAELGELGEFVIAACEAGRVVAVLDQDGDPLGWNEDARAELDQEIRSVWSLDDGWTDDAPHTPDAPRPSAASEQPFNDPTDQPNRTRGRTEEHRQAGGPVRAGQTPPPPR